jgi:FO synthase
MEESISRMAGSYHGVKLTPPELVAAAHRAGRPAAERTTLYEIRRRYDVPVADGSGSPGLWRARTASAGDRTA